MAMDWHSLTYTPGIISFGTQRIPTRNVASISIAEDPCNSANDDERINMLLWAGGTLALGAFLLYQASLSNVHNNDQWLLSIIGAAALVCSIVFLWLRPKKTDLYQIMLLTNGGSITALRYLMFDTAERALEELQSRVSGNDHRPVYVDNRTQQVKVGTVDMSQKTYTATNSPGSVVGDNTNSTVRTNVSIQGVQDVEKLMARIGEIAGEDRGELLRLLIDIRAHLADGSVPKDQAKAAYNDFLGRVGKYFSTASDIVSLVSAIGRFL